MRQSHNYCLEEKELDMLFDMIRSVREWYREVPNEIILEKALYHFGGTEAEALVTMLYNYFPFID